MKDKIKLIYNKNINYILQYGTPWAKYIILKDVLETPLNDEQLDICKQDIITDKKIKTIFYRLNDKTLGVPSISGKPASHKIYSSYFWGLRFFADIGLTTTDLPFDKFLNEIFLYQLPTGEFTINYRTKNKIPVSMICLTAHLTYSLAAIGYYDSKSIKAAYKYIISSVRRDGGWHCDVQKQKGEKKENANSCPYANINVLRALSLLTDCPQQLTDKLINNIYNFIKNRNTEIQTCDNGICEMYFKLRYPPHYWGFDLLNILDTLSLYPQHCNNIIFKDLLFKAINKNNANNLFKSEKTVPEWRRFNFAKKNNFSFWISSLLCRIIDRAKILL